MLNPKKISLWGGVLLLVLALGMSVTEKILVYRLTQELKTYAQGQNIKIEKAQLYFDGLLVKRAEISDRLVLKNVLLGREKIKKVETLELTIQQGDKFLQTPFPVSLYDALKIQYLTVNLPFLDDMITVNGRLQSSIKSDGTTEYNLPFKSQDKEVQLDGLARFTLSDRSIDQIAVTLNSGATRYPWLKAKRLTGWWDYKKQTNTQTGELSIGSLEWVDMVFDNVQLNLLGKHLAFSGDLPRKSGQVDGDLYFKEGEMPTLSTALKIDDFLALGSKFSGKGSFQTALSLKEWDIKSGRFTGEGAVTGGIERNKTQLDFDYNGQLKKQGQEFSLEANECFNVSLLTPSIRIPNKQCFSVSKPIMLNMQGVMKPFDVSASGVDFLLPHHHKSKGRIASLNGRVKDLDSVILQVEDLQAENKNFHEISGSIKLSQGRLSSENLSGIFYCHQSSYRFQLQNKSIIINDQKTGQKIADLTGDIKQGYFKGQGQFNGPVSFFQSDLTQGQALYTGSLHFNLFDPFSQIDGQGQLKITQASFKKQALQTKSLNADFKTASLIPLTLTGRQSMTIKNGQLGFLNFEDAIINFDMPFELKTTQFKAMGSQWQGEGDVFTAIVESDEVLKNTAFDGLKLSPSQLQGQIKVSYTDDIFPSLDTLIFKAPTAGVVSYELTKRPRFLNTGTDYFALQQMREVLQNFQFDEFLVPMNEQGIQGIYMYGIHPDHNQSKPIEMDLTLDQSIE